jgi:hypothetical protein
MAAYSSADTSNNLTPSIYVVTEVSDVPPVITKNCVVPSDVNLVYTVSHSVVTLYTVGARTL